MIRRGVKKMSCEDDLEDDEIDCNDPIMGFPVFGSDGVLEDGLLPCQIYGECQTDCQFFYDGSCGME